MNTTPSRTTYQKHGIEYNEPLVPEGFTVVDEYQPHSCPWDAYGSHHLREYGHVLTQAGIPHELLITHRRITAPTPSGPCGRIRFGDDMMPGIYRIAVPLDRVEDAAKCFVSHRLSVRDWIDGNCAMPAACKP